MTRLSLGRAGLAGALVWFLVQAGPAQDKKPADPAKPAADAPKAADPAPNPSLLPQQAQRINEFIKKGYETGGITHPAGEILIMVVEPESGVVAPDHTVRGEHELVA